MDTVALSGATNGDVILVSPDSTYSGNYEWIQLQGQSGATTGEVNVIASNTSNAAIDAAAMTFRVTRIGFGSFV